MMLAAIPNKIPRICIHFFGYVELVSHYSFFILCTVPWSDHGSMTWSRLLQRCWVLEPNMQVNMATTVFESKYCIMVCIYIYICNV